MSLIEHRSPSGTTRWEIEDSHGLMLGFLCAGGECTGLRWAKRYGLGRNIYPKLYRWRWRAERKLARRERWLADNMFGRVE